MLLTLLIITIISWLFALANPAPKPLVPVELLPAWTKHVSGDFHVVLANGESLNTIWRVTYEGPDATFKFPPADETVRGAPLSRRLVGQKFYLFVINQTGFNIDCFVNGNICNGSSCSSIGSNVMFEVTLTNVTAGSETVSYTVIE